MLFSAFCLQLVNSFAEIFANSKKPFQWWDQVCSGLCSSACTRRLVPLLVRLSSPDLRGVSDDHQIRSLSVRTQCTIMAHQTRPHLAFSLPLFRFSTSTYSKVASSQKLWSPSARFVGGWRVVSRSMKLEKNVSQFGKESLCGLGLQFVFGHPCSAPQHTSIRNQFERTCGTHNK